MSIIAAGPPRVKPGGPTKERAQGGKPPSWVAMPEDVLAIRDLSANAKLLWLAVQFSTWRDGNPTNAELAAKCGWFLTDGSPNIDMAKRAIRELEGHSLKLVERELNEPRGGQGWIVRSRILVNLAVPMGTRRPEGTQGANAPPPGGSVPRPPVDRRPTGVGAPAPYYSDRCRSKDSDPRIMGEISPRTTTMPAAASSPNVGGPSKAAEGEPLRPGGMLGRVFESASGSHQPATRAAEPEPIAPRPARPSGPPPPAMEVPEESPPLSDEGRSRMFSEIRTETKAQDPATGPAMAPEVRQDLARLRELAPDLTGEQEARFAGSSAKVRDKFLTMAALMGSDSVAAGEWARQMGPQRVVTPIPSRDDKWSLIRDALARRDPEAISPAAGRIASELDDGKSRRFYEKCVRKVITGERGIDELDDALRQAMNPTAKNRGKIFVTAWDRRDLQRQIA